MIRVPLRESRTLHHDGNGRWGAGKVMVRAAPPGTGVIAGGPMRAVLETLGVQDVVGKSIGSSNPYNMVRATFEALKVQSSPRQVAAKRGKKVSDVIGRRDADGDAGGQARRGRGRHKPRWPRPSPSPDRQPDPPQERPARHPARPGPQPHSPHVATLEDTPSVRGMIAKVATSIEVVGMSHRESARPAQISKERR